MREQYGGDGRLASGEQPPAEGYALARLNRDCFQLRAVCAAQSLRLRAVGPRELLSRTVQRLVHDVSTAGRADSEIGRQDDDPPLDHQPIVSRFLFESSSLGGDFNSISEEDRPSVQT